jgi:protein-tyrosine-phosphatase
MVKMTRILFLCDRNTVRSPMAAGMLRGAASAGLCPDDRVDPFACAVMLEDGIDITGHVPAAVDPKTLKADTHVIALSVEAFAAARKWREKTGFDLDYWDVPAPPSLEGSRETILDGFRDLREALKNHIRNRFR